MGLTKPHSMPRSHVPSRRPSKRLSSRRPPRRLSSRRSPRRLLNATSQRTEDAEKLSTTPSVLQDSALSGIGVDLQPYTNQPTKPLSTPRSHVPLRRLSQRRSSRRLLNATSPRTEDAERLSTTPSVPQDSALSGIGVELQPYTNLLTKPLSMPRSHVLLRNKELRSVKILRRIFELHI